jgi:hypothetical protein
MLVFGFLLFLVLLPTARLHKLTRCLFGIHRNASWSAYRIVILFLAFVGLFVFGGQASIRWLSGPGRRKLHAVGFGRADKDWVAQAEARIRDVVLLCSSRNRWKEERKREERKRRGTGPPEMVQTESGGADVGRKGSTGLRSLLRDSILPPAAVRPADTYTAYRPIYRRRSAIGDGALQRRNLPSSHDSVASPPLSSRQHGSEHRTATPTTEPYRMSTSSDTNSSTVGLSTAQINVSRTVWNRSDSNFSSNALLSPSPSRSPRTPTDPAFDGQEPSTSDLPYPQAVHLRLNDSGDRFSSRSSGEPVWDTGTDDDEIAGDSDEDEEEYQAWLKYPSPSPSSSLKVARSQLVRLRGNHPGHLPSSPDTPTRALADPHLLPLSGGGVEVAEVPAAAPMGSIATMSSDEGGGIGPAFRLDELNGLVAIMEESGEDETSSRRTASLGTTWPFGDKTPSPPLSTATTAVSAVATTTTAASSNNAQPQPPSRRSSLRHSITHSAADDDGEKKNDEKAERRRRQRRTVDSGAPHDGDVEDDDDDDDSDGGQSRPPSRLDFAASADTDSEGGQMEELLSTGGGPAHSGVPSPQRPVIERDRSSSALPGHDATGTFGRRASRRYSD